MSEILARYRELEAAEKEARDAQRALLPSLAILLLGRGWTRVIEGPREGWIHERYTLRRVLPGGSPYYANPETAAFVAHVEGNEHLATVPVVATLYRAIEVTARWED